MKVLRLIVILIVIERNDGMVEYWSDEPQMTQTRCWGMGSRQGEMAQRHKMSGVGPYRDLIVRQKGIDLVRKIYKLSCD